MYNFIRYNESYVMLKNEMGSLIALIPMKEDEVLEMHGKFADVLEDLKQYA